MDKLKKITKATIIGGLVVGAGLMAGCTDKVASDEYNQVLAELNATKTANTELEKTVAEKEALETALKQDINKSNLDYQDAMAINTQTVAQKEALEAEKEQLAKELEVLKQNITEVEVELAKEGKTISTGLGQSFSVSLTDTDVPVLKDTKFSFKGESYDLEEKLTVDGEVGVSCNTGDEDFNAEPYLMLNTGDVEYTVELDSDLDLSEITV